VESGNIYDRRGDRLGNCCHIVFCFEGLKFCTERQYEAAVFSGLVRFQRTCGKLFPQPLSIYIQKNVIGIEILAFSGRE